MRSQPDHLPAQPGCTVGVQALRQEKTAVGEQLWHCGAKLADLKAAEVKLAVVKLA
ncbi:MAG TPA: hypothetical protein VL970_04795 [Candidatus Acidoferrales bacterium]|nr:hypothetical protein [Candidatus Acidoferrales bacterium]